MSLHPMMPPPRSALILASVFFGTVPLARAGLPVPPAPETLAVMERVADWQLAHPSAHVPTDWTQAAGYTGFMALAQISASARFHDAMRQMGDKNGWILGPREYVADDLCVGQAYAELCLNDHDPRMIVALRQRLDFILAHPAPADLDFTHPERLDAWSWCDSLFMAPPTWIRAYAATGEKAYLEYAVEHWWKTSDYLYNPADHLYFRDSTYFNQREANGQHVYWSRGNGWVLAGLVRMLEFLPADHPARPRFERQYREMIARIQELQQPDGLWRSSLLDPADYPAPEASGSGFYCYALAWGANHGLLDRAAAGAAALRAWSALVGCVQADGKLTHVQPIGADPKHFDPMATETYGVGAFLLAGSEIYRMAPASP